MASIVQHGERLEVVLDDGARVVVNKGWPIVNPEAVGSARCVWLIEVGGSMDEGDANLPRHAAWLDSGSPDGSCPPDEDVVREAYLSRSSATDGQRERFAMWDALCSEWSATRSGEAAAKIRSGGYLRFGLWPVVPGAVTESLYRAPESGSGGHGR